MTSRVAVGLGATGVVLAVAQLAMILMSWSHPGAGVWSPRDIALVQTAIGMALTMVGFVIVTKRRGKTVGWLLLTGGVLGLGWWLMNEYAVWGLIVAPGSLPGAGAAVLLSDLLWVLPFGCVILMLLVFPTGRLLSRAWWLAVAAAVTAMVLVVPGLMAVWGLRGPVRVLVRADADIAVSAVADAIHVALTICLGVSLIAAVASMVVRWRRSEGIERLQLKWVLFAGAITLSATLLDSVRRWARVPFLLAFLSIPIAVGVAVLRYRLYEIDRIIRRTVTYAVVSVLVGSVFAAVAVLPSVVPGMDSDLVVAAATLVAAGVFRPLHARVRMAVDRRFNRSRYDAGTTVQGFASRLRDDTSLDDVVVEVLQVVRTTLEPTSAAVLLRGSAGAYGTTQLSPSGAAMHQIR